MMILVLFAVHCTWVTEAKGSSTDNERKAPSSRPSSRRTLSNRILQFSPEAESSCSYSSSSSSDSSMHERLKDARTDATAHSLARDYEIEHRDGKRHSNCNGLSRRAEPLSSSNKRAIEYASKSTSSEQLEVYLEYDDSDTEPGNVVDSEQSEFE